ncbi:hypothetical protein SAPIO_CDS6851 [Scedosporium apiospermum]|uniref:Phenol 2-monooxygenase n=1 Tax=Pseudallescheria apiosperma TaxID=563466 RepID=A0A084G2X2_PSEDA|nr:uncharacterized protein SAPIO_CDS6851 [Scedosporium apiospermum]KEZ41684.1 hypothetical protein SAPIO_CDS6851 [Scedosporium apiospermum]
MPSSTVSNVDVLIIGAGPSGLMLSTWMARLGIKTRIIDKRFSALNSGQADGLQSRTFEIFDSLGIGQDIWREATHMLEIRFWNPDGENKLCRTNTIVDTQPGLSRFQQATIHQAQVETRLQEYARKHSGIEVERGIMPESLQIDTEKVEEDLAYPIEVTLRHLPQEEPGQTVPNGSNGSSIPNGMFRSNLRADGTEDLLSSARESSKSFTETVRAKYVVGCDGAHSWTRRQIGSVMEGEQTDFIWGVLDIIPITNFPDIRYRCAIHSSSGSMMIIPRENKYVRLYIQITQTDENGTPIDRSNIEPDKLITAAKKILAPYDLSYKHSYNLGWKLAYVVKGWADRSLLKTYSTERRQIAKKLIDFDHKISRLFSGRPAKGIEDKEGIDLQTFKKVFEKGTLFASGCSVDYAPSLIVKKSLTIPEEEASPVKSHRDLVGKQSLATKIPIGMRIPSHKVLNQADARPWHLQELLPSSGAWRILVFAGDLQDPAQLSRYEALGKALALPTSFLQKYRMEKKDGSLESLFEVLTIHSSPRDAIELLSLPEVFHPFSEEYGWDYNKVFVDEMSYHEGHGQAYENYGIDPRTGCLVVVRPDQYVSWVGDLEDVADMDRFFSSFLKEQTKMP